MTRPDDQIFSPGDKVIRTFKGACKGSARWNGKPVKCNTVYCVLDCWETSIGWQLFLVGFGTIPIINGFKTGWPTWGFRKVSEVGHPAIAEYNENEVRNDT